MNNNPERYGGMEHDKITVEDELTPEVKKALHDLDGAELIEVIRQTPDDEIFQTIGLRVQLRDFWIKRKTDLAHLADEPTDNLEEKTKAMFESMDADLRQLAGHEQDDNRERTEQTEESIRRQRHEALIAELERLDDASRIDLMTHFAQLDRATLDTPERLLPWMQEWRDQIVEQLWSVVQDSRENGDENSQVQESFNITAQNVHGHLGKLIQGALHPVNLR